MLATAQKVDEAKDSSSHTASDIYPIDDLRNLQAEPQWAKSLHFHVNTKKIKYIHSDTLEEAVSARRIHKQSSNINNPK